MKKENLETLLNKMCSTGADFAEVYIENTKTKIFTYLDNKLQKIDNKIDKGMGLRIAKGNEVYYAAVNNNDPITIAEDLINNLNSKVLYKDIKLSDMKIYEGSDNEFLDDKLIKDYMNNLNHKIRLMDKRIEQVSLNFTEILKDITIANHTGLYNKEKRCYARFYISVTFKDSDLVSTSSYNWGMSTIEDILNRNIDNNLKDLVKYGIDKLYAKNCVGKKMPVILGPGFGAVIFHEACGHAMEANATARKRSVLSDMIGKKIASSKVTIIDDGTIPNLWGTTKIDDEGYNTKKNYLIKDGILVNYLNDTINNRLLKMNLTGSSRRESYYYPPVSRMNNTYLEPGNDSISDMVKSIKYGLYAKEMNGGSVNPETGDFNFGVATAYMIRDGKVCECVKGASLIGNTLDILNKIEMVSSDLEYGAGMCGAASGMVPVTIGEPTIKVSEILVGGIKND